MNAQDRKAVSDIVSKLEELQSQFESIKEEIQNLADDEQGKYNNLSEGLQQSEKGQAIEQAASTLEEAAGADSVQDALDALGNIE